MLIKGFTGFAQKCEKHTKCMEEASDKFLKTFGGNFFHFYSTLKVSTTELQQDVWSDGCGSFSDMNFIF